MRAATRSRRSASPPAWAYSWRTPFRRVARSRSAYGARTSRVRRQRGQRQHPGLPAGNRGLTPIRHSTRPLSGTGVGPAQIEFGLTGRVLVVTEKNTNAIDTYRVRPNGRTQGPNTHPSAGQTPFGFVFAGPYLVPTEAFGGAAGASAVSSYRVTASGWIKVLSASVPNGQSAACWAAISPTTRDIYVANTGSNTVSRYSIDAAGLVRLREGVAGTTGAAPADETITPDGRYLYVLNGADGHHQRVPCPRHPRADGRRRRPSRRGRSRARLDLRRRSREVRYPRASLEPALPRGVRLWKDIRRTMERTCPRAPS